MTKEDRNRAEARLNKVTKTAADARSGKNDRDAGVKAVLDNMARLKALRLAREAAEPRRRVPKGASQAEQAGRKESGAGRVACRPAKRWTADLENRVLAPVCDKAFSTRSSSRTGRHGTDSIFKQRRFFYSPPPTRSCALRERRE
jgi:hypothetical protein